jgi:hypothetical protein
MNSIGDISHPLYSERETTEATFFHEDELGGEF